MRNTFIPFALSVVCLAGCGSSDGGSTDTSSGASPDSPESTAFNPPAVPSGFTRLQSKTVSAIPPGGDVTYCQYVMPPIDHDVDILKVSGVQSKFGHHAVAFTYTPQAGEEPGSSFPCMGTEFSAGGDPLAGSTTGGGLASMGAYLGGVGGEGAGEPSSALPDGVAFRLQKGQGIMLNVHYLNTGDETIDGNAVVDVKMAEAESSRTLASMFVNLNLDFEVMPSTQTTSTIDCVAKSDIKLIMMSNHMHEFGDSATSQVIHADGSVDELHHDATWTFDMQFNPVYSRWTVEDPYVVKAGDTVRTTCNWTNSTPNDMKFPREMCLGVGFALATGENPTAPLCANGIWVAQGI
jgi:hypothetical protein